MDSILVIDDDLALCRLLQRTLCAEGYDARFSLTGAEGLQMLRQADFQLVLLDVMLPGADGFALLARIRAESDLPVLMLTARNDSASKVRGLRTGADDYLAKPFAMEELLARVQSLIRRYTRLNRLPPAERLNFAGLTIDPAGCAVFRDGAAVELLPKEYAVLLFCARHQGQILTKKQIYEAVWQAPYAYDDSNIMATISRLRKKIEPDPAHPTYLQTVKGFGYRFSREV